MLASEMADCGLNVISMAWLLNPRACLSAGQLHKPSSGSPLAAWCQALLYCRAATIQDDLHQEETALQAIRAGVFGKVKISSSIGIETWLMSPSIDACQGGPERACILHQSASSHPLLQGSRLFRLDEPKTSFFLQQPGAAMWAV